jgi:hypothetical protein
MPPQQPYQGMPTQPPVVIWARVYAAAMALLYLICTAGGVFMLIAAAETHGHKAEEAMIQGVIFTAVSPLLLILALIAAFAPRKKWGWIMNIALMGIGCTSCFCLPLCIPLMIFWMKPETKSWYGMV